MQIVKRNHDDNASIVTISNGFLVELNGRNSSDDWQTEKIYCKDFALVIEVLTMYFNLELIK